jgi:hypothetical protein
MQPKADSQGAPMAQARHSYPLIHGSINELAVAYANHLEVEVSRLRQQNIDLGWAKGNAECRCDSCRPSATNPLGITTKDLLDDSKRLCAALEAENVKLKSDLDAVKADVRRLRNTLSKRISRADRVK